MSEDRSWESSTDAQDRTQMLERPEWMNQERRRRAELKKTMHFDRCPASARERPEAKVMLQQSLAEEEEDATAMIDPSRWRQEVLAASVPLLDGRKAKAFPYDALEALSAMDRQALQGLIELMPVGVAMTQATAKMGARLSDLVGLEHQVRWQGMNRVREPERGFSSGAQQWTWARVPPGQEWFAVAVQRSLADAWVKAVDSGSDQVIGDDFERGITTFLLAEAFGAFVSEVGWLPWNWAINPLREQEMSTLVWDAEVPLLEVDFAVKTAGIEATISLWLPSGVLPTMKAQDPRQRSVTPGQMAGDWWKDLVVKRPMIAGQIRLSKVGLQQVRIGDVLILARHGVRVGEAESSAEEEGVRWMIGAENGLWGSLSDDGTGQWCFEMIREGKMVDEKEVEMSQNDSAKEEGAAEIALELAQVTLQVRIGSVEMELGSLAKLQRGQIVDCNRPVGSPVDLVVGATQVGRGELVTVDGKLGVRVLSMGAVESTRL